MKQIKLVLSLFVIAMSVAVCNPMMAQSRKEKKAAKKAEWEFQQKKIAMERQRILDSIENASKHPSATTSPAGATFDLPCLDASRSDKEYFRQLGIGEDMDLAIAQEKALDNAKKLLRKRLGEHVKGLTTTYTKTVSKSNKGEDLEGILESELTGVVDGMLNDADNPCSRPAQLMTGAFRYYYVAEIRKNDLADKFSEAIDKNAALKAEYDRDKFRQYAEEYMRKLQESQNGQK